MDSCLYENILIHSYIRSLKIYTPYTQMHDMLEFQALITHSYYM